jgi:PAS domain S-box-containing protein
LLAFYKIKPNDRESIEGKQIRILALLENTLLADSMSLYELKKLKATALVDANHRLYHNYLWITLWTGLFFALLVILMGYWIIQAISMPINKLIDTTKELAAGNLSARPTIRSGDEIGILAKAFSSMADQLQNHFLILEKKVAERTEALSEEQKFISAVLDTTNALVVVCDPEGNIERFNNACQEITGYAFAEVKGKPVWELLLPPEQAVAYKAGLEQFKKGEQFDRHENFWITKQGSRRLIEWSHTALFNPKDAIVHIVATGTDITEKRKMEQALFKVWKLESMDVLAGGIAHDFNNLLTSIHGEIELAQITLPKGTKTYYSLQQAIESCNRARALVWQFITISKGNAPQKSEGSLLPLIQTVCARVFMDSKIQIQISQADDLWPTFFDGVQMEQVIQNLVVNAKEAMDNEGLLRIWLENVFIHDEIPSYILQQGKYIRMIVQDQGRGIPEKHLPLLFDPYFSTKERGSQKGMGLGLSTAYSIIKKHGGYIDLVTKVGIGTTFYIYLPVADHQKPG